MRLFHGSNVPIERIELERCRPYKDFGRGFYLAPYFEQAKQMAYRTVRLFGGKPFISEFELDYAFDALDFLSVCRFPEPSQQWAEFVMNNRNRLFTDVKSNACNHDNKYDVAIGPVANDDLALLFRQFESGYIDLQKLSEGMRYKQLSMQVSFHTPKAVSLLKSITGQKS